MKFADRVVHITVERVTTRGQITTRSHERIRFGDLTDRAKLQVICELLGVDCQEPPPPHMSGRRPRLVPASLYFARRRYLFDEAHEVKSIIDYTGKRAPEWAEEGT